MPTSLGGGANQGIRIFVKNGEGEIIPKGTIVTWSSVAANNPAASFLDLAEAKDFGTGDQKQRIPYITVKDSVLSANVPGATAPLGVAATDIEDGGFGEIVTYGLVQVESSGTIAAGITVAADANGAFLDAAAATHDDPFGITLESSVDGDLAWCFVNFIGAAVGCSAAGFMGQAY